MEIVSSKHKVFGKLIIVQCIVIFALTSCTSRAMDFRNEVDKSFAITNISVININSGTKRVVDILIKRDRIIAIGLPGEISFSANTGIIDGRGKYAIPGLWDAHAHIAMFPEDATQAAKLYVANGITSIRDMGGQIDELLELREYSLQRGNIAPRMWISGPIIDGVPRINVGDLHKADISVEVDSPSEAIEVIDMLARRGVDFIKPYQFLRPEVFEAIVRRAQYHGLPLAGHIPSRMTIPEVIELVGYDIQHTAGNMAGIIYEGLIEPDLLPNRKGILQTRTTESAHELLSQFYLQLDVSPENMDDQKIDELIDLAVHKGMWNTPTLGAVIGVETLGYDNDPFVKNTLQYQCKQQRRSISESNMSEEDKMLWEKIIEKRVLFSNYSMKFVKKMQMAGIKLLAGGEFGINGFNIHLELKTLVKAGLSPLEALQTATLNPAKFFNIDGEQGSIEVGKLADMVLLDSDPLLDIDNTRKISAVISKGEFLDRHSLDRILQGVAQECD